MITVSPLVDTHAHPMDSEYASDLYEVFDRASACGVQAIVCVGYDLATSRAAVDLSERISTCFAAVGIHPNYVGEAKDTDLNIVEELARAPKVVAIGETGLDYFRTFSDASKQRDWFSAHLQMGARLDLPVVIHNREAFDDTLEVLDRSGSVLAGDRPRGVMHCFSGDVAFMEQSIQRNLMISFAGPITFRNAGALPDVARGCPTDRYVVETDSPYLSPHPFRGKRNEPARVAIVAEQIASIRGTTPDQVALESTANAARLFPLLSTVLPATRSRE